MNTKYGSIQIDFLYAAVLFFYLNMVSMFVFSGTAESYSPHIYKSLLIKSELI